MKLSLELHRVRHAGASPRVVVWCWLLLLGLTPATGAHEFWITPNSVEPVVDSPVIYRLSVGDGFSKGEPFPRDPEHLKRFWVRSGSSDVDLPGVNGSEFVGAVRPGQPGPLIAAYASHPTRVDFEGAKFDAYLAEEGLHSARRTRLEEDEVGTATSESFRRCAKSLIHVGLAARRGREVPQSAPNGCVPSAAFSQVVGLELEIVPETDPAAFVPGTGFTVRVERPAGPVGGLTVRAQCADDHRLRVTGRTGPDGRVELVLPRPGFWLISTVSIRRLPPSASTEWESVWSSLTFHVGAPSKTTPPTPDLDSPSDGRTDAKSEL